MVHHLFTAVLFVVIGVLTAQSDQLDCSAQQICFGSSTQCDPNTNCELLFQFDQQGNLDVQLRNFNNPKGYVAFAISELSDGYNEYLMCIPHDQRRLRVAAEAGSAIQVIDEHMARYVSQLPDGGFKCTFLASELKNFNNHSTIIVNKGVYADNLVISSGQLLTPIESDDVYIHRIASSIERDDAVITPEERKKTSDLLGKISRISKSNDDDDFDLENLLGNKKKSVDDELDEDLDDMLDSEKKYSTRRRQEKKESSRRRHSSDDDEDVDEEEEEPRRRNKNKRTRPSRYENSEEDFEDDEDDVPMRKSKRPSRRNMSDDDEDVEDEDDVEEEDDYKPRRRDGKPKRNNKGRKQQKDSDEEDEYDVEENDEYEDDVNSENGYTFHCLFILPLIPILLGF